MALERDGYVGSRTERWTVDLFTFLRQVEIASRAGASGFLAGRAVWKEVSSLADGEIDRFLETVAAARIQALAEVVKAHGRPFKHRGWAESLCPVTADWYRQN